MLKAKELNIGYSNSKKKTSICSAINFELKRGELLCLLGRNGTGKSTLLKTISKMLSPISGELYINNKNITQLSAKTFAENVAVVLTEKLPENVLTVYETIALGRQPYTNWTGKLLTKDVAIINNAMALTDTKELSNKMINELSDGQLQRVMIARALAQDTPIILLDEPTSHLDIHHKINIFKILKKISKETDKTILISTHEINMALKNSDRILLINNNSLTIGKSNEETVIQSLKNIFNSSDIQYDEQTQQFVF